MSETMIKALMSSMGLNPEGIKAQLTKTLTEFKALVNEFRQRDNARKAQLDAIFHALNHRNESSDLDGGNRQHDSDLQIDLHGGTTRGTRGETGTVSH